MRIVALTDIHAAYDVAEEILRQEQADIAIIGGDLTMAGTVAEAEEALVRLKAITPTLLCVAGNMDFPKHDDLFTRLGMSINGRGVIVGGIGFFGVSGAPISGLHTHYELPEEEIARRAAAGAAQVKDADRKVFVPHAPPYGTKLDIIHIGIHVGSTSVREAIEHYHPDLTICGHIHEGRGQDIVDEKKIVNCGLAARGYYAVIHMGEKMVVENRQIHLL